MARQKGSGKRPIEQYQHTGKEPLNNPPAGLFTPATDPDPEKKKYAYDLHFDLPHKLTATARIPGTLFTRGFLSTIHFMLIVTFIPALFLFSRNFKFEPQLTLTTTG